MIRLDDIVEAVRSYHADADMDALRKAYVYSAKVHQGQTRLSGDPYMSHPMEVAFILTRLRMDVPTIVTGLLHDTLEDTLTTEAELRRFFGDEVTEMVDGVTKISGFEFEGKGGAVGVDKKLAQKGAGVHIQLSPKLIKVGYPQIDA